MGSKGTTMLTLTNGLVVLGLLALTYAVMFVLGRNERAKRTLTCPRSGNTADVDVVQRYQKPDETQRVASCSELPDPNRVDCEQDCVKQHS